MISRFQKAVWNHYRAHPREMPWRATRDPYRILISEIMLQQTQVARVAGFYEDFIKAFPGFGALARSKKSTVLRAWQGLGYNRRALALRELAKAVMEGHGGRLPRDAAALMALPGVGKYTAGAVRAFVWNEPEIFIETNIRRVFIHFFFPRRKKVTDAELARYIGCTLDRKNPRAWYYALMDYGAMLGRASRGGDSRRMRVSMHIANPNRRSAHYMRQSAFAGSDREMRGKILRILLSKKKVSRPGLVKKFNESPERIAKIVSGLHKDGFILMKSRSHVALAR